MNKDSIELLAPARDIACGMAAVEHGADAVYIGGPLFSARAAAANSLADIERLASFAHQFRAKVYVALNTLLTDEEIEQAVHLSHQLYEAGVDALIIQDVGLLECDLPPIALHASTQMNNRTVEKVRFLEKVGFSQVVLARELSLAEIRRIRAATNVTLECFVHGALCVAYSGQCYISEVVAGRSANRGRCAQFCRHAFDLRDAEGKVLAKDRYLLSLRDLDLSGHLTALADAGVRSFKIEGRLKDVHYVKNVTAAYRQALDTLLAARPELAPASSGRCRFGFQPDPARSFSRGATDYFLNAPRNAMAEIRTPKSIGKGIGRVRALEARSFSLDGGEAVHNGDGLCFFSPEGMLIGLRVNRVEEGKIFPREGVAGLPLTVGTEVFRNLDVRFNRQLETSRHCRTIEVQLALREAEEGLVLECRDEDGLVSTTTLALDKIPAHKPAAMATLAARQLKKSGETIFTVAAVQVELSENLFCPAAALNDLRRQAFTRHLARRLVAWPRAPQRHLPNNVPWPAREVDYRDNITNTKAEAFFRRHGVERIAPRQLRAEQVEGCALMTTRYCLKAQLGLCHRLRPARPMPPEPFTLADRTGRYTLEFDCQQCEMTVSKQRKR